MCGSSSDSNSTTNNTTKTEDRTLALNAGGTGISGDTAGSITITNTTSDAGIVTRALDSIDTSNAIAGQSYDKLLQAAETMFGLTTKTNADLVTKLANSSSALAGQVQQSVAQAWSDAQTTAKGTVDNRTVIILGVAAVVGLIAINRKA